MNLIGNTFVTAAGDVDTLATQTGGPVGTANKVLQLSASSASLASAFNPTFAPIALTANLGALNMAVSILTVDITDGGSTKTIFSDFLAVAGDATGSLGAIAQLTGNEKLGPKLDLAAAAIAATSLGTDANEVIEYLGNLLSPEESVPFVPPTPAYGLVWTTAETALSTAVGSLYNLENASSSAFLSQAASTENSFASSVTPLNNLFVGSGAAAQNVNETEGTNATSFVVANASTTAPVVTANVADNSDGSLESLQNINVNGSGTVVANGNLINYASGANVKITDGTNGYVTTAITASSSQATETFSDTAAGLKLVDGQDAIFLAPGIVQEATVASSGTVDFGLSQTSPNFTAD